MNRITADESKRAPDHVMRRPGYRTIVIRPFQRTDRDYAALVAVENANFPDSPISVRERRFRDETWDPKYLFERILAESEGRVIGYAVYGQPWWSFKEGKFFFGIEALPAWHKSSVIEKLYKAVSAALKPLRPDTLVSEIREDQVYLVDFLHAEGFEAVMRLPISELDVQRFDSTPFEAKAQHALASGITVDSLTVVAGEECNWETKLWNLEWEIVQDVPSPDPLTRQPFDQWRQRYLESPDFLMAGQVIARDGHDFVGLSCLWKSEAAPEKLYTGLTGVVRSHRRRGIATAMKIHGIKYAQESGIEIIETDNEENNPMFEINMQLGFVEKPAFVMYEKNLRILKSAQEIPI